ncbi:hypothetical protein POVCU2_0087470 [Plasmodium ovale curtisi]|uniref:PIR Superfamily Protein n=1 Tax=Plasmodium ovale curtisi TaxID=864141 RepID=A0A1A8WN67_PLAOA|nr:hypothetical protein POVCU2_0087470 [Plasmodium ovale curtisi]
MYPFLLESPLYLIYLVFSQYYPAVHSDNPICNIHINEDPSQENDILSICLNLQMILKRLSNFIESKELDYDVFYCQLIQFINDEFDKIKELYFRVEILNWIKMKFNEMYIGDDLCDKFMDENSSGLRNTERSVLPSGDQGESSVFHNPDEYIQVDFTKF